MRYFDYQYSGTLGRIWSLFSGLGEISEEQRLGKSKYTCEYSHTLEIVNAALSGSLSTSSESVKNFNLQAYEYTCKENDNISKIKSADKLLFIVDDSGEDNERVGFGDIQEKKLTQENGFFDEVFDSVDFENNFSMLVSLRGKYIKEKGIDLVSVLKSSLNGIPDAIKEMQVLLSGSKQLKDLVVSLCENGQEGKLKCRLDLIK